MSLLTYSPEDITILLAGIVPVEGYVDGTFISISKDIPPFTSSLSADGATSRVHRSSGTYTINLALMATSPINDILTKLWQIDEITKMGKWPLMVKDQIGSSIFFAPTCWIEQPPNLSYSTSLGERDWIIKCSDAVVNIGGNDSESDLVDDLINTIISVTPSMGGIL